ncbi:ferric iron uptake transcriptional regulator [Paenibacillus sp. y28]|uniref:ferric iron uptake transcriptional regulator n=1 Tax=Paenibacillus sp. y28 TaxID=3129110 RepID=UPI003019A2CC
MNIAEEIERINRQITSKGYKLTRQREITLTVLLENEKEHLSAEEVFMRVKEKFPHIGLATVYRSLELLVQLRIVEKMNFGDGLARYDLRHEDHEHMHHHLICTSCGALEEIQDDWLSELEDRLKKEYGFQVTDHRLDFMGSFKACSTDNCKKQKTAVS